jgi:MtN3 and saliva related transmembrane protein
VSAQLIANIVGTAAGICGMVGFTPQIAKILREKDASSVSLKMYAVTTTGFVLWTTYGFILKSWPIAGSNLVMLCLAATILVLKLRYR